jgi:hypothetical protein
MRVTTLYRFFNPFRIVSPHELFRYQISQIEINYKDNTSILGDFNLDWNKKSTPKNVFKNYFEDMDQGVDKLSLTQLLKFTTWSRMVNDLFKCSVLDCIYHQHTQS